VHDFETALNLLSSEDANHAGRSELMSLARGAREKYAEVEGKHLPAPFADGSNITPYPCDSLKAFAAKAMPAAKGADSKCVASGRCTVVTFVSEVEEEGGGNDAANNENKATRIAISMDSDSSDSEEEGGEEGAAGTPAAGDGAAGFRRIAIVEESDSEDEDEAAEAQAAVLKDEANALVKQGQHAQAEEIYSRSLALCGSLEGSATALAVYNNRAMVRVALQDFQGAGQDAAQVLRRDPANLKALYRRALACFHLNELDAALETVGQVLQLDPANKQAAELAQKVKAACEATASKDDSSPSSSSSSSSFSLKEQGNAAVAAKDYAGAVGLYTQALALLSEPSSSLDSDSTEQRAVLFSNRAQALLRLERFEDAEADCSEAISLCDANNLPQQRKKAAFRRALAYRGLGGLMHLNASISDLEQLLAGEPGNKTFAKELGLSQALLQEKGGKVVMGGKGSSSSSSSSKPNIDGTLSSMPPVPPQDIGMKEGKTTKRNPSAAGGVSSPLPPTPPATTTGAGASLSSSATAGKSTTTPTSTKERSPLPKVVSTKRPTVPAEAPKTVYELEKVWRALKSYPDLLAQYLAVFKKGTYKKVFKETVSPDLLSSVFAALRDHAEPEVVQATLDGLGNIPSFGMMSVLLSAEDQQVAREALARLEDSNPKKAELIKKFT
jgi:tetratricopeptide (TPR) repeat protein